MVQEKIIYPRIFVYYILGLEGFKNKSHKVGCVKNREQIWEELEEGVFPITKHVIGNSKLPKN